MRPIAAALALTLLATAAACGSACQDLGNRICSCQTTLALQDACKNAVKTQLGSGTQPAADQSLCQAKLATCPDPTVDANACDEMNTEAGKVACGLAYPAGT